MAKDDVQTAHEYLHYDIMKNIDSNSPESPEQQQRKVTMLNVRRENVRMWLSMAYQVELLDHLLECP